jgi:hypothetical protein
MTPGVSLMKYHVHDATGLIQHVHVDEEVTGKELAAGFAAAAFALGVLFDFGHAFHGKEDLVDEFPHLLGGDAAREVVLHLLLLSGENVNDVPLVSGGRNGTHEKGIVERFGWLGEGPVGRVR